MNASIKRLLCRPSATMVARIAVTFPFWSSGFSKLLAFDAGAAEMAAHGLEPAAAFNAATVIVQLGASALIVLGRFAWLGAAILTVFTALTIVLVHRFWAITDEPFRTIALHVSMEHVGIIGGLVGVAALAAVQERDGRPVPRTA